MNNSIFVLVLTVTISLDLEYHHLPDEDHVFVVFFRIQHLYSATRKLVLRHGGPYRAQCQGRVYEWFVFIVSQLVSAQI